MRIKNLFYLIFIFVALRHALALSQSFVDIPYRDSWQIIQPELGQVLPLSWFLKPHNEHVIYLTKLEVWFLTKINAWNVVNHLWLNLFVYLAAIFSLFELFKSYRLYLIASMVFLFSNLNWENHSWEFQSCFHFFILFLTLTVLLISRKKYYLAALCNILMLLSFSAAIGATLALIGLLLFKKDVPNKFSVLFLAPCFLYLLNPKRAALVLPYKIEFWDFLLNLVSFGFGFESYSWILGLACLLLVLLPMFANLRNKTITPPIFLSLALLASLSVIAVGRAGNSDLHIWSKGSRYFEIASMLVPCALVMWLDYFSLRRVSDKKMYLYTALFLLVPFIGNLDNWDYSIYKWIGEQKAIGRECMRESKGDEIFCKTLWSGESSKQLAIAKTLNLSFTKN